MSGGRLRPPPERAQIAVTRELGSIAIGIARRLVSAPLLLGYVVVKLGGALALGRPPALVALDYLVLLPCYVVAIRWWTRRDRPLGADDVPALRRARLAVALALPAAIVVGLSIWALCARHPAAAPILGAGSAVPTAAPRPPAPELGQVLSARAGNAFGATLKVLLPTILLCAIAGLSPRRLRLAPRYLGLAAALIAFGVGNVFAARAAGLAVETPLLAVPTIIVPYFALQLFVNGLPEELLCRGMYFQRWLGATRSAPVAFVVSSVFFSAFHLPWLFLRADDASLVRSAIGMFVLQPNGLVWAYLFYRTRSLVPGILWHTSNTVLGVIFF